jgi:hypothetical protein
MGFHAALAEIQEIPHIPRTTGWGDIAPVEEGMDTDMRQAASHRKTDERFEMGLRAMNTTVGEETHKMQGRIALKHPGQRFGKHLVGTEAAILDGPIDAAELLPDYPAGADIQVPYLGITHLPIREPDIASGSNKRSAGIASVGKQLMKKGGVGSGDGVIGGSLA